MQQQKITNISEIIKFTRQKNYKYIENLDRGSCGTTVLLFDETIDEYFVCKKYLTIYPEIQERFYKNFKEEIKLLHMIFHKNIVRIFNYHLYPERLTGYILMKYIKGDDLTTYLEKHPENINDIFLQVIDGFSYLENQNILHRDIRPLNIMVNKDGLVKIIDFGFGKRINNEEDFDKSISLNWWCDIPLDFKDKIYNFKTEIYFIGKLFEQIIQDNKIENFEYIQELSNMCKYNYEERITSFNHIKQGILNNQFIELPFSENEKTIYRSFVNILIESIESISNCAHYKNDIDEVQSNLESLYKNVMLEDFIPKSRLLTDCFIEGGYCSYFNDQISIKDLQSFILMLRSVSKDKKNVILGNIQSRLEAIERFYEEEIPF